MGRSQAAPSADGASTLLTLQTSVSDVGLGKRVVQHTYDALYYLAAAYWEDPCEGSTLVRILALLSVVLQRIHLLLLSAGYDSCYGTRASVPADGAAADSAGCLGRNVAYRVLTLGRAFGLSNSLVPFIWLIAASGIILLAWLAACSLFDTIAAMGRIRRLVRSADAALRPALVVPVFLAFFAYLSCHPDRPAAFPCFWGNPTATGVAALLGAIAWLALLVPMAYAAGDARRRAAGLCAVHAGAPEALLVLSAVALVAADQFIDSSPAARGAVQIGVALLGVAAPALYYLPYHRPLANYLHAAWACALPVVYCTSTGLRAVHGEAMGGASWGNAVGSLAGSALLGAAAGLAACYARYAGVVKRYDAAWWAGGDATAFVRPVDAVIAARLMAARVDGAAAGGGAGGGEASTDGSRSSGSPRRAPAGAAGSSVAPEGAGRAPFASPSDGRLEELVLRAVRELHHEPRVLVAAAGWALSSENAPLCAQYLRRLRDIAAFVAPEWRYAGFAVDRARKEAAAARGEETVDLHALLAAARGHERKARVRMRAFWNMLLKDDMEMDRLPDAVALIEASKQAAGKLYERLQRQFPNSARVARAHASFLHEFSLDIEGASRLLARAINIEEAHAMADQRRRRAAGGGRHATIGGEAGDVTGDEDGASAAAGALRARRRSRMVLGVQRRPEAAAAAAAPTLDAKMAAAAAAAAAALMEGRSEHGGSAGGMGSLADLETPSPARAPPPLPEAAIAQRAVEAVVRIASGSLSPVPTGRLSPAPGRQSPSPAPARSRSPPSLVALPAPGAGASEAPSARASARLSDFRALVAGPHGNLSGRSVDLLPPPPDSGREGGREAGLRSIPSVHSLTDGHAGAARALSSPASVGGGLGALGPGPFPVHGPGPAGLLPPLSPPSEPSRAASPPPPPQGSFKVPANRRASVSIHTALGIAVAHSHPTSPPAPRAPSPAPAAAGAGESEKEAGGASPAVFELQPVDERGDSDLADVVARRYYRQRLMGKSGHVVRRIRLALFAAVLACLLFLAAFYTTARILGQNQHAYFIDVLLAADVPEQIVRVAFAARSLLFAATSDGAYVGQVADQVKRLQHDVDDLHGYLYDENVILSNPNRVAASATATSAWFGASATVALYDADARPAASSLNVSAPDAIYTYFRRAAQVANKAAASFAPQLATASAPPVLPIPARAFMNDSAYRFLIENASGLERVGESLQTALVEDTRAFLGSVARTLAIVFACLFGPLVIGAVAWFATSLAAIVRERKAAISLFHEIPRSTIKEIRDGVNLLGAAAGDKGDAGALPASAAAMREGGSDAGPPPPPWRAVGPGPVAGPPVVDGRPTPRGSLAGTEAVGAGGGAAAATGYGGGSAAGGSVAHEEGLSVEAQEADFVRSVQTRRAFALRRLTVKGAAALVLALLFPVAIVVASELLFQLNSAALVPVSASLALKTYHPRISLYCQEYVAMKMAPWAMTPTLQRELQERALRTITRFEAALDGVADFLVDHDPQGADCDTWDQFLAGDSAAEADAAAALTSDTDTRSGASCLPVRQQMLEIAAAGRRLLRADPSVFSWRYGPLLFLRAASLHDAGPSLVLDTLTDQLVADSEGRGKGVLRALDAVFAVGAVLVILTWFAVLQPSVRGIAREHEKTLSMLLMIPPTVIDKIPALRDYMATGESRTVQSMLEDNRAKTKSILEAASDAIIVCDSRGSIQVFNAAAERLLGYTTDEALAMPVAAIVPDVLPAEGAEAADEAAAGHHISVDARRKGGGTFPAHVSVGRGRSGRSPFFVLFIRDVTERQQAEEALQAEKARGERLLRNILPDPIIERLKQDGDDIIADAIDEATILFSDLVGFTALASELRPEDTVGMLSELFNRFDDLIDEYGIDKVKTIGDAYMCFTVQAAERMIDFALDMMETVRAMNKERGTALNMRVGIHTGPIIAGVIGTKRLAYDIWGDAVNLASRMESSGVPGRVQVSPSTYERVRWKFDFEEVGGVQVKGKGTMTTYLVTGRSKVAAGKPAAMNTGAVRSTLHLRPAASAAAANGDEKLKPAPPGGKPSEES